VAYDESFAERLREVTDGAPEKRMFGSVAFCVGDQIAVCVRGDGLLVRVGKDGVDEALRHPGVETAVMGDRQMLGWVTVSPEWLDEPDLRRWWQVGVDAALAARSKPAKKPRTAD